MGQQSSCLTRVALMCLLVICWRFSSVILEDAAECSPRCWNPVQLNSGVWGATKQEGVANEEECKALCVNNGTCIGVDWNRTSNGCWFQLTALSSYNGTNVNHWSLANCSGECASYCWKAVQDDVNVNGGTWQSNITDENRCKLLCSNISNCIGIDWDSRCYLIYIANPLTNKSNVRHWDIARNMPTSCQSGTSPTVAITSNTVAPLQNSTESFENKTTRSSDNLTSGIIVLAVLLGLCILIIIGLVINTIRIGRQSHLKSDIKSVELSDNYEGIQRPETKARSEDETYTELVQVNPKECAHEQTN